MYKESAPCVPHEFRTHSGIWQRDVGRRTRRQGPILKRSTTNSIDNMALALIILVIVRPDSLHTTIFSEFLYTNESTGIMAGIFRWLEKPTSQSPENVSFYSCCSRVVSDEMEFLFFHWKIVDTCAGDSRFSGGYFYGCLLHITTGKGSIKIQRRINKKTNQD